MAYPLFIVKKAIISTRPCDVPRTSKLRRSSDTWRVIEDNGIYLVVDRGVLFSRAERFLRKNGHFFSRSWCCMEGRLCFGSQRKMPRVRLKRATSVRSGDMCKGIKKVSGGVRDDLLLLG